MRAICISEFEPRMAGPRSSTDRTPTVPEPGDGDFRFVDEDPEVEYVPRETPKSSSSSSEVAYSEVEEEAINLSPEEEGAVNLSPEEEGAIDLSPADEDESTAQRRTQRQDAEVE